ncbi:MAG TPA: energy transducer TonB [Candidatus Angelobacter sp.]|nr:energy transducer TonB [Candidatus Angelobacter sp.]
MHLDGQDTFFTSENNSLELLQRNQKQAILSTLSIEAPPRPVKLAGREFSRLDYSGAGLYHAIFATDVRCHVISFEATSRDPGVLEKLFQSIDKMSLPLISNPAPANGQVPRCVKDYATGTNVIHKVDPVQVGPRFTKVPVRIIIDEQGKVKHIHVINAVPDQAASIQAALEQWVFKPYIENGTAIEVETGLLFEFSGNSKTPNGLQEVKNEVLQ